jgi:hypothetical protein
MFSDQFMPMFLVLLDTMHNVQLSDCANANSLALLGSLQMRCPSTSKVLLRTKYAAVFKGSTIR